MQRGVKIELAPRDAAVAHFQERQLLESLEQALGLDAAVRFDVTDDDIRAAGARGPGSFEHRIGLPHAGRGAKEDPQPSAPRSRLLPLDVSQQFVRIAALSLGHYFSATSAASVRKTRGSMSARRHRFAAGMALLSKRRKCAYRSSCT